MIARLRHSALIGAVLFAGSWVALAAVVWLNTLIPWWIPVSIGLVAFIIEFATEPLFKPVTPDMRERARQQAVAELEAMMSDQSLTER